MPGMICPFELNVCRKKTFMWWAQTLFLLLLLVTVAQQIPGLPQIPYVTRPDDVPETPQYLFNLMHIVIVLMLVAYYTTPVASADAQGGIKHTNFHHPVRKGEISHMTVAALLMSLYPLLNVIQYIRHQTSHFLPVTGVAAAYAAIAFGLAKYGVRCAESGCAADYVTSKLKFVPADSDTIVSAKEGGAKTIGKGFRLHWGLRTVCDAFGFGKVTKRRARIVIALWIILVLWRVRIDAGIINVGFKERPEETTVRIIEFALLVGLFASCGKPSVTLRISTWGLLALLLYALANRISPWFCLDTVLALVTFITIRHITYGEDAKPVLRSILCV